MSRGNAAQREETRSVCPIEHRKLLLKDFAHAVQVEDPKPFEHHLSVGAVPLSEPYCFQENSSQEHEQLGDSIWLWHMRTQASNLVKMKLILGATSWRRGQGALPNPGCLWAGVAKVRGGQGLTLCCRKQDVLIWMSLGQAAAPVVASLQPEE